VRKFSSLALAVLAMLGLSGVSHATLLSELIANSGTIEHGDKVFRNFTHSDVGGTGLAANQISVLRVTDVNGNLGIRLAGPFFDLPVGGASDTLVGFDVEVTDQNRWISDVHLLSNGTVNGGHGFVQVTETISHPNWIQPLQMTSVESHLLGGQRVQRLADRIDPLPRDPHRVKWLRIVKDIQLLALDPNLPVNLSFVDQTFSQVPEPASMGMAVAGVLGLLAARRRV